MTNIHHKSSFLVRPQTGSTLILIGLLQGDLFSTSNRQFKEVIQVT